MSLESWKGEFYKEFTWAQCKGWTWEKCIEHSLRKWKGLLTVNRSKHKVLSTFNGIRCEETGEHFIPSAWNCALCVKHSKTADADEVDGCERCPIVKMIKKNCFHAFQQYSIHWSPRPMIKLLEKTLKLWRAK